MSQLNMPKRQSIVGLLSIAIFSQLYLGIVISPFRVSLAIVIFSVLAYTIWEEKFALWGVYSGIFVYFLRLIVHFLQQGNWDGMWLSYAPEILFYASYGIFFSFLRLKKEKNFAVLFLGLFFCDVGANFVELFVHYQMKNLFEIGEFIQILFLVGMIRSLLVIMGILLLRGYRRLLLKEEHEERYQRLIFLFSLLKGEMYLMEKGKENLEQVMTKAYTLYRHIAQGEENNSWEEEALCVSKDIHEIKKEYNLIVRGIEEIIETRLQVQSMSSRDVLSILRKGLLAYCSAEGRNVSLQIEEDAFFYTKKHYELVSVLRNLLINAYESFSSDIEGKTYYILCRVTEKDNNYQFIIEDNGAGIESDSMEYIFLPRYSTKVDYNTGSINRGLGLCVVKEIVEQKLFGEVLVKSQKGIGTTFVVSIPKKNLEES